MTTVAVPTHGATLSPDGLYRYELHRRWDDRPAATFVMLNPSTADADNDDPTIRRCTGFAKAWGCGGIIVVNLYALRSTDPKAMLGNPGRVGGAENDIWLELSARAAEHHRAPLVAAWGANAERWRVCAVLKLPGFDRLTALGVTKSGAPRHPLYMPVAAQLSSWSAA